MYRFFIHRKPFLQHHSFLCLRRVGFLLTHLHCSSQ